MLVLFLYAIFTKFVLYFFVKHGSIKTADMGEAFLLSHTAE